MKRLLLCLLALTMLHCTEVYARSEPMPEFTAQQILDKTGSPDTVKKALKMSAAKLGWQVVSENGDTLRLSLVVHDKHSLVIDAKAGTQAVDITYVSSINLNYQDQGGEAMIHPSYGRWVANLIKTAHAFGISLQ